MTGFTGSTTEASALFRSEFRPGISATWRKLALWFSSLVIFFSMGRFAGALQKEQEILRLKHVLAERYELRRADGKTAAVLSGDRGQASLSFLDRAGNERLILGLSEDGLPRIDMNAGSDTVKMRGSLRRLTMKLGRDGMPEIALYDSESNLSLSLAILLKDTPQILLVGKNHESSVSLAIPTAGSPIVSLADRNDQPRIMLAIRDDCPLISLYDKNKAVRSSWQLLPSGIPAFSLFDRESREQLRITTDASGRASIQVLDRATKQLKELASRER